MSNLVDESIISPQSGIPSTPNLSNMYLPSGNPQQMSTNNINLPPQATSPGSVPMISLNDSLPNYGRKVSYIDPRVISDKLRETSNNTSAGLLSPTYSYSPGRTRPPLGSVLQTPPDLTPTNIPRNYASNLAPARSPAITKSINDFLQTLPSAVTTPISVPPTTSPSFAAKRSTYNPSPKNNRPTLNRASFSPSPEVANTKVQDAKKRADYRVKFSILREAYPQMNIPEPNDDETIEEIEAAYKEYVKKIHVESSVEQNKVYLLILWLIIDVVGTRCFRLPFHGRYVKSQFKYMQKYQMLLIELGESSYVNAADGWPVEFRLLAMAIFHGVIFALVQMLASKLGGGNAANDKMADEFREVIDNFLTNNKGADVLRRAEQANADNPIPASSNDGASAPLGDLGTMIGNWMPTIMSFFGGGEAQDSKPAAAPQVRRPTTFGSRHRKAQANPDEQ